MLLRAGREFEILLLLIGVALYLYWLWRAGENKPIPDLRNFPAINAISEGVGRSVELDEPVHFGLGDASSLSSQRAAGAIAALNFLEYTARKCAQMGGNLIVRISPSPNLYMRADAILTEAYQAEGKIDELDKIYSLRYYGSGIGYLSGGMHDMDSLGTAMNITMGALSVESVWAFAICRAKGGIGIGGGSRWGMNFGLVMLADYALLGDEMYAGSAKISDDRVMISSFLAGDWLKYIILGITVVAAIGSMVGMTELISWIFRR
jgi:hypothetical protein